MQYWMTHPKLTPDHDHQIEAGALAGAIRSGWQIRDDQADPVAVIEPADPRPVVESGPDPIGVIEPADPREPVDEPGEDTPDEPAPDVESSTTEKKEQV